MLKNVSSLNLISPPPQKKKSVLIALPPFWHSAQDIPHQKKLSAPLPDFLLNVKTTTQLIEKQNKTKTVYTISCFNLNVFLECSPNMAIAIYNLTFWIDFYGKLVIPSVLDTEAHWDEVQLI